MNTDYQARIAWFQQARFGMFIHWGLYALPAKHEWLRSHAQMRKEDYQVYFDHFNPDRYNPRAWAKLAKKAGMKYAVLTAKHHDGFCLFDSALTDYKATNTPAGRDLVREYVDAFRAEGLKVGLYYSLIDWHHEDYPHYGDEIHPMRNNKTYGNENRDFNRYLDYMHGQVRELCTNYGRLDILWFDFAYGPMRGEVWRATELVNMVRGLQPHVIIDNRLEVGGDGTGSLVSGNPTVFSGDFVSPEQIIPPQGIRDVNGNPVAWEACVTMNNHWSYCEADKEFKSAKTIVRKLVECVSKGGNLLMNVGPDARGKIPPESITTLTQVGEWMENNNESIYGCGASPLEKPQNGYLTQKNNITYLHVLEDTVGPVPLRGIKQEDIVLIQRLTTGAQLNVRGSWTTNNYPDYTFISFGDDPVDSHALPDEIDTVVKITLK